MFRSCPPQILRKQENLQAADDATGEVEAVDNGAVADVLDGGVVGIELRDYGRGEDAEGVGDEVVAEPGRVRMVLGWAG